MPSRQAKAFGTTKDVSDIETRLIGLNSNKSKGEREANALDTHTVSALVGGLSL